MPIKIPEGETIQHTIRRHWYVYFQIALGSLVLTLALIILLVVGGAALSEQIPSAGKVTLFFVLGVLLLEWSYLFLRWINYHLDMWVVTETRVYDIEQHSLFVREVSEIRLDKVQDITVEVHGMIATFLNFGDVHIQTAGKSREFIIRKVKKPYEIRNLISQKVDALMLSQKGKNTAL